MSKNQPTEVELQILNVLWKLGSGTVRQVHDALQEEKETHYATTVKMLAVMHEKGLVKRDQSVRPQIYKTAVTQKSTQRSVVQGVVKRLFAGSAKGLVLQALSSGKNTQEELDEIQALVDELRVRDKKNRESE